MKLNAKILPNMQNFIEKNKKIITASCIDRALVSYFANEAIYINKPIMGYFGCEIAAVAAIFVQKQENANEVMDDLDLLQGYFKSKEAMELHLQSRYQIDKNEEIWFAYPFKKICYDTSLSEQNVAKILKALRQMQFFDHIKETNVKGIRDWYKVSMDAYYGMVVYATWKLDELYDRKGEDNDEKTCKEENDTENES